MDQIRSGRFIAEERKKKGYTQRQLAEKLNISDKTISKWECGNGFPEVSLLLPLCEELGITVNDLLSGELVSGEDYQKKAEDNMVERRNPRSVELISAVTFCSSPPAHFFFCFGAGSSSYMASSSSSRNSRLSTSASSISFAPS